MITGLDPRIFMTNYILLPSLCLSTKSWSPIRITGTRTFQGVRYMGFVAPEEFVPSFARTWDTFSILEATLYQDWSDHLDTGMREARTGFGSSNALQLPYVAGGSSFSFAKGSRVSARS